LIALGLSGAGRSAIAAQEPAAIGFWLNQAQGWVVETKICDTGICGFLVGFREAAGQILRDWRNPDPAKRGAPECGLMLLGGFMPSKDQQQKWEHGWVYDPVSASTYTGEAQMVDGNTIKLRGYVLIPLFGRTLTLVREVGPVKRCSVPRQD
jgi:uncharacterized protein (DUF2147 family)